MYKAIIMFGLVLGAAVSGWMISTNPDVVNEIRGNDDEGVLSWHVVAESKGLDAVGEASPAGSECLILSVFLLDYGEDPGTVLANNATDWSSAATVHAYVDSDDFSSDCKSEDPFYFVVRARFNTSVKDGADFIGSRCRCNLTVSGDESISDVGQVGDDDGTDNNGGGVVSTNGTEYIYINFWWDDNSDGYRLTDDGSITLSEIKISAKY